MDGKVVFLPFPRGGPITDSLVVAFDEQNDQVAWEYTDSTGFAKAHPGVGNLSILTQGPEYSEGLPVTPAWEKMTQGERDRVNPFDYDRGFPQVQG